MAHGHLRRAPEGDDEAEIDRVAHQLVEPRGAHLRHGLGVVPRRRERLAQPEQLGMTEQERADQHRAPPDRRQRRDRRLRAGIRHGPHGVGQWPPLPEQQRQRR